MAASACGGFALIDSADASGTTTTGTSSAATLLQQTFSGTNKLTSGVLHLTVTVTPHGSSALAGNIMISADGPFQSEGAGKLPDTDITFGFQAEGKQGSLQVIASGGKAYIEIGGTAYSLPPKTLKQLDSSMSSTTGNTGASNSTQLKQLGINPLSWVTGATLVGQEQVYGAQTNHIHATVDAAAMLRDVSKLLGDASKLGVKGVGTTGVPTSLPPSVQNKVVQVLGKPSLDIWTGTTDNLVRKLTLSDSLTIPASARKSLGGLTSADLALSVGVADVNQPQQVQAPTNPQPFSALRPQLNSLLGSLGQSAVGGTGTSGTLTGADEKYARCIAAAKGDVTKMQRCNKLLGSGK